MDISFYTFDGPSHHVNAAHIACGVLKDSTQVGICTSEIMTL